MLEVVEAKPQFGIAGTKLLVPFPEGEEARLPEPVGSRSGRGEGLLGVRPRHQEGKPLELGDEQLSEHVRSEEELVGELEGGEADLSMLLLQ